MLLWMFKSHAAKSVAVWSFEFELFIQVPLQRRPMYHDITNGTEKTLVEIESDFGITTDIPYLTLTGELWGVYCDDFDDNWLHYN